MSCQTCADKTGTKRYCPPKACYCGHPDCDAFAYWIEPRPLSLPTIPRRSRVARRGTTERSRRGSTRCEGFARAEVPPVERLAEYGYTAAQEDFRSACDEILGDLEVEGRVARAVLAEVERRKAEKRANEEAVTRMRGWRWWRR